VPIIPEVLRSKVSVLVELHRKRRALERLNRDLAGENAELVRTNLALETKRAQELERLNANLEQVNYELGIANQALKLEIMERRRVEERLRELDRRKDEFLATLAHELRNPLAPLLSGLETLRSRAASRNSASGRARSWSASSRRWCAWSTTCSTSRASPAAGSSSAPNASRSTRSCPRRSSRRGRCSSPSATAC
jgi:signal transduction histidine kinase